jgi:hypothetical protein
MVQAFSHFSAAEAVAFAGFIVALKHHASTIVMAAWQLRSSPGEIRSLRIGSRLASKRRTRTCAPGASDRTREIPHAAGKNAAFRDDLAFGSAR